MSNVRRIKPTHRQAIARHFDVSTETVRRWIRLIEGNSLDWIRLNPQGKTPRYLHPYQQDVLAWVLTYRNHGSDWIENALLHDPRLTFCAWQQTQKTA